jgi:hypothetical protein
LDEVEERNMNADKNGPKKAFAFLDLEKSDSRFVEMVTNIEMREKAISGKVSSRRIYFAVFAFSWLLVIISLLTSFDRSFAIAFFGMSYAFFLGEDIKVKALKAFREMSANTEDKAMSTDGEFS